VYFFLNLTAILQDRRPFPEETLWRDGAALLRYHFFVVAFVINRVGES
jgi:hypothetical protein